MSDVAEAPGEALAVSSAAVSVRRKDLSKTEEERLYTLYITTEKAQRFLILEAFEGKAHKAYKVPSFEDYCRDRLGLSHDASHLSRIVSAARVERAITGQSCSVQQISEIKADEKAPKISQRAALEIAKLPEQEWVPIFQEHVANGSNAKLTPAEQAKNLARIVGRKLMELFPDKKPAKGKPAVKKEEKNGAATATIPGLDTEDRVKPDMTPVVPPTYDGSEEQQAIENGQTTEQEYPAVEPRDTEERVSAVGVAEATNSEMCQDACSLIANFIEAMEGGNEVAVMGVYNDCTAFQTKYGL